MAAGIFLSWSMPDEPAVTELKRLLQGLGFPLWEYRDGIKAGDDIHAEVLDAILDSLVTIVCFSDESADRPWLAKEIDYAYAAYDKVRRRILPVWVGPHPDNKKPAQIAEWGVAVEDLTTQAGRERFINETVSKRLNFPVPLTVPAALFTLDAARGAQLFDRVFSDEQTVNQPEIMALCRALGMHDPPALREQWARRYGATERDFSPFENGRSLMAVVQETVDQANALRRGKAQRPLYLRWMHEELRGDRGQDAMDAARDRWSAGRSLLIVDSIATLEDSFVNAIDRLPDAAAMLWIPPYTLHTNTVADLLRRSVRRVGKMGDAFRQLERMERLSERQFAFDASTSMTVRLWLHRTFIGVADSEPNSDIAASVRADVPGPMTLSELTSLLRQMVPNAFAHNEAPR